MTVQLIAIDLDGTLLDSRQRISSENIQAIAEAMQRGIVVVIATGRGYHSALEAIKDTNIPGPFVFSNGGEVWLDRQTLLRHILLDEMAVPALRKLAEDLDVWYWAYSTDGLYDRDRWHPDEGAAKWLKFGFYSEVFSLRHVICHILPKIGDFSVTSSHEHNIEVNPHGVDKALGLRLISKRLGIPFSNMLAIGDSDNDTSMIGMAGIGVAMGNASTRIKSMATEVTRTNDDHGVAEAIRKHVLK
jgi:HAD superfamily hydrolase (TIGR01484 family)